MISVIIRCKNEERWIGHAVQSVLDHIDFPEIIIINNKSTDDSINIVKQFIRDPSLKGSNKNYTNIKIVNLDDYSPGKALNLGVQSASKQHIMVLSAHCMLKKINLNKHIEDLENYSGIFGKQNPIYFGKKILRKYIWKHFIDSRVDNMFSDLEDRYFFHNAISFFKKEFLLKNKFNESVTSKEDRYWAHDIVKKNLKYLYDPEIEADHFYTKDGNTWKAF